MRNKVHASIDFGTTNTVVSIWNHETDAPEILHINDICRNTKKDDLISDSYTIPSCVYLEKPSKAYPFPFNLIFKKMKSKVDVIIGQEALTKDGGILKNNFTKNFKRHLNSDSFKIIAKLNEWSFTAEEITTLFLRKLFSKIRKTIKKRISQVTICVPVDYYEVYRARLNKVTSFLDVGKIRTIDEPVAACIGYGLNVDKKKNILVIDFGAGTLDFAFIQTDDKTSERGTCRVLAKEGVPVGGNLIDSWIVEHISNHFGYDFDKITQDEGIQWWYRILLEEACRLKEALYLKNKETFYLMPTFLLNQFRYPFPGDHNQIRKPLDFTKKQLIALLKQKGLYKMLEEIPEKMLTNIKMSINDVDEVLLIGGSTLLPQVYSIYETIFGRDRVRAWQPFNAVAFGASAFSANKINKTDCITHDYAFITYNINTHEPEYNIVIPSGTVFPTIDDFWKKQLTPTCALGDPEKVFKLIVCEIGRKHRIDQDFLWDEKGDLHYLSKNNEALVIPLNEDDPTLGTLNPPHMPNDRDARLEVSFMVNEEKWLCTTVKDLKIDKILLDKKPVIRLK